MYTSHVLVSKGLSKGYKKLLLENDTYVYNLDQKACQKWKQTFQAATTLPKGYVMMFSIINRLIESVYEIGTGPVYMWKHI